MTSWKLALEEPLVLAVLVFGFGITLGYAVRHVTERLLRAVNVPDIVEGTPFERTAQSLGTSTTSIVGHLLSWFVYGVAALAAIQVAQVVNARAFWTQVMAFVPNVFVAVLVLIVGFVVADKAELLISERLKSVKLPEASLVPRVVKYSVLYVAVLIALGQIGVHVLALVVLLGVYCFALVFLGGLAFGSFLRSGAAGLFLLLTQPYGIGDEVRIDEYEGVVQEVDLFVTRIEGEERTHVVPNEKVMEHGVTKR